MIRRTFFLPANLRKRKEGHMNLELLLSTLTAIMSDKCGMRIEVTA